MTHLKIIPQRYRLAPLLMMLSDSPIEDEVQYLEKYRIWH